MQAITNNIKGQPMFAYKLLTVNTVDCCQHKIVQENALKHTSKLKLYGIFQFSAAL